jgi:hypothetical protein
MQHREHKSEIDVTRDFLQGFVYHSSSPLLVQRMLLLLLLLLVPSPTHGSGGGGGDCASDADCSLNGLCAVDGECACDSGWSGISCGKLDLLPVQAEHPAGTSGQIWPPPAAQQSAWGGNVVAGAGGGEYELIVSDLGKCGLGAWQTNSRIVSAKAKQLTGPYVFASVTMAPFAHNANPVNISAGPHQGATAVFHVGDGVGGKGLNTNCTNGTTPPSFFARPSGLASAFGSCKLDSAKSDDPIPLSKSISTPYRHGSTGPWSSAPQSCVGPKLQAGPPWFGCPHFSNGAPLILANGTTFILHSGCPGNQGHGLNLAVAPTWTGPFRPVKGLDANGSNAWYTPSIDTLGHNSSGCTDPYLWVDPRGRYHALFHCHWHGGGGDSGDQGGHVRYTTASASSTPATTALLCGGHNANTHSSLVPVCRLFPPTAPLGPLARCAHSTRLSR